MSLYVCLGSLQQPYLDRYRQVRTQSRDRHVRFRFFNIPISFLRFPHERRAHPRVDGKKNASDNPALDTPIPETPPQAILFAALHRQFLIIPPSPSWNISLSFLTDVGRTNKHRFFSTFYEADGRFVVGLKILSGAYYSFIYYVSGPQTRSANRTSRAQHIRTGAPPVRTMGA